MATYR